MPRALCLSVLLLPALAGCQIEEGRYTHASLSVELGTVYVYLRGRHEGNPRHPCPRALLGPARVNGIAMEVIEVGGPGDPVPDSEREACLGLEYRLDLMQLPADTKSLEVTFDDVDEGAWYQEARGWHLQADWAHKRIWTEDDLAARMRAQEEFEVRCEPADEAVPMLELVSFDGKRWRDVVGTTITRIASEPGRARFRFDGPEPETLWNVTAELNGTLENTSCRGFAECEFHGGDGRAWLHPVGIKP